MRKVKLSDIYSLQMGKTPSRSNPLYWGSGHQWISIADLGKCGKYIEDTKESITDVAVEETGIKMVPKNTLVMSFKLSIGKTAITKNDMYTNEAIMAFLDKHVYEVDINYMYHLCSNWNWLDGSNKAVLGLTLNKATLADKKIPVPDISKQVEIAKVFDKLDDIIEKRKNELQKLDELVKSRFIEMFGDPAVNPKEWQTLSFDEVFDIASSKRILKSEWKSSGIPFLRVRDLVQLSDTGHLNCEFYISDVFYSQLTDSDGVPQKNDILISATSTLGKCHIVEQGEKFYFKDADVLRFRAKIPVNPIYFVEMMKTSYVNDQIKKTLGITTVSHFTIKAAKKIFMRYPIFELQNKFADFVTSTNKPKTAIQKSLDDLETLKKSLMQQYFA